MCRDTVCHGSFFGFMKKYSTSWGHVASWYDELLSNRDDTYHTKVILPKLIGLLRPKKGETILDLACGQGFFTRAAWHLGCRSIGIDIARELIDIARKKTPPHALKNNGITYRVGDAGNLSFLSDRSIDGIICILALQNIERVSKIFKECARVLKQSGRILIVLNHPVFRIPQKSSWGWDGNVVQYRRIDEYLSLSQSEIRMHPGSKPHETTTSFHRPLGWYAKEIYRHGFCITRMEEWVSHKISERGPRATAENRARKEIPLFLCLEIMKYDNHRSSVSMA